MPRSLPNGLTDTLLWSEELGYGWHTREPMSYDGDYFQHYRELDATPMGAALTRARIELVGKFIAPNTVIDIGIGGGLFVEQSGGLGFDVNPEARTWLERRYEFADPYRQIYPALTCWDSLEHIPDPEALLAQVGKWLFVSMPIYDDLAAVLASKHYKPGEHIHYWTLQGFIAWAGRQGFECMEVNHAESELGREGITSFAFKRISDAGTNG